MEFGNISNNSFGLNTNFSQQVSLNSNLQKNNSAYYAKKGEPMYLKEMDADEDGIVSFDEFKDYCKEQGISTKEMVKMVEMANSYRTMQSQKKTSKNIQKSSPDTKEIESEAVYAKRGDAKYDEVMDINNDDKITYKEYIEYCREHSKTKEKKSSASDDENVKSSKSSKAINAYSEKEAPEGRIEEVG